MIRTLSALALSALIGYLLGCSNMALYLSRLKGVDLRSGGSGNLGASNALVMMGWWAGILTAVHDIGKAVLAVVLVRHLFEGLPLVGAVAGVACVLGHMYPFYLHFRGGKGFASYLGMTLALNWKLALVILLAVALITLISDYIVLGTVTTVIAVPAYLGCTQSWILAAILCIGSGVILWKHRENFVRLAKGEEIGLRGAHRGDHRAKT